CYKMFHEAYGKNLPLLPSEYIKKHFLFSFIREPLAIQMRDFLPVENLMWGTDFPHSVGSVPHSQKWLEIIFQGAPDSLRRKILLENPSEYFGLDLSKP